MIIEQTEETEFRTKGGTILEKRHKIRNDSSYELFFRDTSTTEQSFYVLRETLVELHTILKALFAPKVEKG